MAAARLGRICLSTASSQFPVAACHGMPPRYTQALGGEPSWAAAQAHLQVPSLLLLTEKDGTGNCCSHGLEETGSPGCHMRPMY